MELKGKVAIITGGASGLGKATVQNFLDAGARVSVFDFNQDAINSLKERLGDRIDAYQLNVADEAAVQAAINTVAERQGAIHICCNFAGIGSALKTYSTKNGPHPLDYFKTVIDINLVGTFNVVRLVAEKMAQNEPVTEDGERGVIINTASAAGYEGQIGQVAYSASKGGVIGMNLVIARDLAPLGIRCNTIVPGMIGTPLMLSASEKVRASLVEQVQFPKRLGKPEEIAQLARSMVENSYMNGECVRLDGGIRMAAR